MSDPEQNGNESTTKFPDLTDSKMSYLAKIGTLILSVFFGLLIALSFFPIIQSVYNSSNTSQTIFWILSIIFMAIMYFSTIYTIEYNGNKNIMGKLFTEKVLVYLTKIIALIGALAIGLEVAKMFAQAFRFTTNVLLILILTFIFAVIIFRFIYKFIIMVYCNCIDNKEKVLNSKFKGSKQFIIISSVSFYFTIIILYIFSGYIGALISFIPLKQFPYYNNFTLIPYPIIPVIFSFIFAVIICPVFFKISEWYWLVWLEHRTKWPRNPKN